MNLIVLTYANYRNSFVDEWEETVKRNGLNYKILGSGEKWEGHMSKLKAYSKELENINDEYLVILCDSFDLLFLSGSEEIIEKYNKLTPEHKIVFSYDNICPELSKGCSLEQLICHPEKKEYICAGFIMGIAKDLRKAHKEIITSDVDFRNDDQVAWSYYKSKHCDEIVLDTNWDICLTYNIIVLSATSLDNYIEFKDGRIYNEKNDNYPSAVHMPAQILYPSIRSEKIRNYLFKDRTPNKDYLNNLLKIINLQLIDLIILIALVLLFLIILFYYITRTKNKTVIYTLIFLGILGLTAYIVFLVTYG